MSRFLDRYLPRNERRTALWLALGGAGVVSVVSIVDTLVLSAVRTSPGAEDLGTRSFELVAMLVGFAVAALLVAALIRFARAPKALALYVLAGAVVSAVAASESTGRVLLQVGVGLGALGGAWIAETVSLARLRDAGFSGDAPDGKGLSTARPPLSWAFIGWEGKPLAGDGRIAIAMVATTIIPVIVGILYTTVMRIAGPSLDGLSGAQGAAWVAGSFVASAIAWVLSTYLVTKRSAVRSAWLGCAVVLSDTVGALAFAVQGAMQGAWVSMLSLAEAVAILVLIAAAALLGSYLALRHEPATLSSGAPRRPEPPQAPDETAGDDDE